MHKLIHKTCESIAVPPNGVTVLATAGLLDFLKFDEVCSAGLTDSRSRQDDDALAWFDQSFGFEAALRLMNPFVGLRDLLHGVRLHAPIERHLAANRLKGRESNDGSGRALLGDETGRASQLAERHDRAGRGGCRCRRCCSAHGFGKCHITEIALAFGNHAGFATFFRSSNNAVHDLDGLNGMGTDCRFRGQHHGICPIEDRIGDV